MDKETLRMQMLSGVITESEYAAAINQEIEETEKDSLNEHYVVGGIVGIGAINQIPSRAKADYEDAFEHFLGERYQVKPNRERDDIKDVNEEEKLDEYVAPSFPSEQTWNLWLKLSNENEHDDYNLETFNHLQVGGFLKELQWIEDNKDKYSDEELSQAFSNYLDELY